MYFIQTNIGIFDIITKEYFNTTDHYSFEPYNVRMCTSLTVYDQLVLPVHITVAVHVYTLL